MHAEHPREAFEHHRHRDLTPPGRDDEAPVGGANAHGAEVAKRRFDGVSERLFVVGAPTLLQGQFVEVEEGDISHRREGS
jgi:hypothetical protein